MALFSKWQIYLLCCQIDSETWADIAHSDLFLAGPSPVRLLGVFIVAITLDSFKEGEGGGMSFWMTLTFTEGHKSIQKAKLLRKSIIEI